MQPVLSHENETHDSTEMIHHMTDSGFFMGGMHMFFFSLFFLVVLVIVFAAGIIIGKSIKKVKKDKQ